ncbi:MAG TPA: hypothetical protein VLH60_00680, partial [Sedimentisphaerales bacterium]|nr:hypothetical protein [Sedimentisphaerales bacterium]
KATAPMYIVNPYMQASGRLTGLFSTHPPIEKRVAVLRAMMHGAGWKDYTAAYSSVTRRKLAVPASALKSGDSVPIRQPASEPDAPPASRARQVHKAADIARAAGGFVFVTCKCGLKMKVPPALKGRETNCPRCRTRHKMPA